MSRAPKLEVWKAVLFQIYSSTAQKSCSLSTDLTLRTNSSENNQKPGAFRSGQWEVRSVLTILWRVTSLLFTSDCKYWSNILLFMFSVKALQCIIDSKFFQLFVWITTDYWMILEDAQNYFAGVLRFWWFTFINKQEVL